MTAATPAQAGRRPERIDGYAPIRDYAVIGNKRTAALVALDGSIDWLPLPRFSSPSVFGAILDRRRGGSVRLSPTVPFTASRRYRPDTNVLETTFSTADGSVRVTDAMSRPTAHTLLWNQVIRRIDGLSGRVPMAWSVEPRFDYGGTPGSPERQAGVPTMVHGRNALAVEAFDVGEPEHDDRGVRGAFDATEGHVGVFAISDFHDEPLTFSTRDALLAHLDDTGDRWSRRADVCRYDGPWRDAVRRSALTLDLLIDDANGAIAAAPTMGLPERIGGSRNFDYRYAWLRDGNLTVEAMQALGFGDQVHASVAWMLRSIRRTRPRLRAIYGLDGRARLPDAELDLEGYRGSRPVLIGNGAQEQLQLGNFGDVFDMTHRYAEDGNALSPGEGAELAGVADYLCRIWTRADASIWELSDERDYTHSKLSCLLALQHAQNLAERGQIPGRSVRRWRAEAERLEAFIATRCWSSRANSYARAAGSDELDAAVLLASRGPFLREQHERFNATIDAIRSGLDAGGPLVYRFSGMADAEGAFVACSFWLAEALARAGRVDEAAEAMDALVGLGNDVGLFSEEIDPGTGDFLGNMPQALSHLALVTAAQAIAGAGR